MLVILLISVLLLSVRVDLRSNGYAESTHSAPAPFNAMPLLLILDRAFRLGGFDRCLANDGSGPRGAFPPQGTSDQAGVGINPQSAGILEKLEHLHL